MNPKRSNSGFFVILLILVMAAYYFISVFQPGSGDYSYQQLMRDVKANHVTAITIKQNKEVPTGTVTAELGKDNYKSCEVTAVNIVVRIPATIFKQSITVNNAKTECNSLP